MTEGNGSLLGSFKSNQFILCRVSFSMVLCFSNFYDKAYSLLIAGRESMESLTGILLDVSESMSRNIGEGTDEKGGPWARSIFEVIDNLIKYDISPNNHVFAIGFGASCGEDVFDIIGTLKHIPNQDNVAERPATFEHIKQIFDVLERAGARTVRRWAEKEVVSEALTDNLAVVFLNKLKSDQPFLKVFVEECLPPACRDWAEYENQEHQDPIVDLLQTWEAAVINFGIRTAESTFASVVTKFRTATVADVKEVVEKAKAYLLKKVDADSVFNVQDASDVVHGCVDEKNLTNKRSRELLQRIEPYIYGKTPFFRSVREAIALFRDSKFSSHKKLLFILSDGVPTDGEITGRAGIDRMISRFTEADVTVVSCFVTNSTHIDPKRLFSKKEPDWNTDAKFMFSLSSKLSTQSLPRTMFVKRDWTIDITNNETHLFLQVNHPENLREACQVARNVVCCQEALSDLLASVDLDLYINQELKGYEAKLKQKGATCYANAAATVLHLSMKRILGREGGCPDFYKLRQEFINSFGRDGANTFLVLQKMCRKYRLRCKKIDLKDAMEAITSSRPVVATFWLTKDEWERFGNFFQRNPNGILTKEEINKAACRADTIGHAVVLTSFDSQCLRMLNSWGETWGDMGFFRVQNADVLGMEFIDVFWDTEDLTEEEKTCYEKRGSEVARKLMNELPSLTRAEFKCPRCSEISPVMEFTGTLSHAKCPKCRKEFYSKNAEEGNILALNIYLTSLIS